MQFFFGVKSMKRSPSYKTFFILISLLAVNTFSFSLPIDLSSLTGKQIIDEVELRHSSPNEYSIQEMILVDKKGYEEKRHIRRYSREDSNGLKKTLVVFDKPSGIKGVALLTWEENEADDQQWIYLPAYGNSLKRTLKGNKSNYFMGTDFTYEDLSPYNINDFSYIRQKDENNYFVIDSFPNTKVTKKESAYKYKRSFIQKEKFIVKKTEFYNKKDELIKTLTNSDFTQKNKNQWRPNRMVMNNNKNKHKTIIMVTDYTFEIENVPEKKFTKRWIISGRYLKTH
jgi:hypothetical protein